jgi:DNA-binding CsgD family transcriptional regulator
MTARVAGWSSGTGRETALRLDRAGLAVHATARGPGILTELDMLHGRAVERSVVDGLLAGACAGRSGVLVVRGDPGVGKTALLDYAAAAAGAAASGDGVPGGAITGDVAPPGMAGIRVLRGSGVESEAELSFAGLHVLLRPVLGRRFALPQPQRDALSGAFGLRRTEPGDRFLVGLAVLSLLAELAEDGPLLCLVDDAHWLDRSSAEALVFAARRLDAEGIAIIFAARDHNAPFPALGLPVLRLGGLDAASAAGLLSEHGFGLPPEARSRVLAEAQGNPLALIELCAAYHDPAAGPGGAGPALTDQLQQAFEGQVRRLPGSTQTLLLVAAAAGSSGDLGVVLDAARMLGAVAADMGLAEQAGLVRIAGGTAMFRHPLVRAAVYQGAGLSRRLAVHRALAAALRNPADADRRAWHLAAAATGPDEAVAAELERTAPEAVSRSGYAAAAAAYERAVQLTADPPARAGRLMLAAAAAAQIGEFDRAGDLAARAAVQTADPIVQARLANVRAQAHFAQGRLAAAHRLLVNGAARITDADPPRAIRMLMYAMHVAWFLGDQALLADTAGRLRVVGGSGAKPLAPLVQLMLRSAAQAAGRPGEDLPRQAELVAEARRSLADHRDDLAMVAMVSLVAGLNAEARDLLAELVADARAQGRIGSLPTVLTCLAMALLFDGRHRDALARATEALRIARDTGQAQWAGELNGIMAYLAAVEGDQERCRALVDAALTGPASHVTVAARPWADWALGLLDLGLGRLDTALVQLEEIARGPVRYHASALRSIPDLVEAAVRLNQPDRAAGPLARFCAWAHLAGQRGTDALAERCYALLDTDQDAERHYLAALKLHDQSFEQARTQLLYGAWLRRARRKAEARTQLRAAAGYLDRIGATPWAARAHAELSATGVTAPRPGRAGLPRLTPQELQVARLAAGGLSNRDIAAQLFLSPRTVGYHLYKAYPKLGIASRSQLNPDTLGT